MPKMHTYQKKQVVEIEERSYGYINENDFVGHDRLAVLLGIIYKVGSDGSIDRHGRQNERGQVRRAVNEKRDEPTQVDRLGAHVKVKVRDEYDVAEAEQQNHEINNGEEGQVDERRVLAHVLLHEHDQTERVPEQAHDEQEYGDPAGEARVEVVDECVVVLVRQGRRGRGHHAQNRLCARRHRAHDIAGRLVRLDRLTRQLGRLGQKVNLTVRLDELKRHFLLCGPQFFQFFFFSICESLLS